MNSNDSLPSPEIQRGPGCPMSLQPANKHVRVEVAGTTVVDSVAAMVMLEDGHAPVYYFPREEIRMDLMHRSSHSTH